MSKKIKGASHNRVKDSFSNLKRLYTKKIYKANNSKS